MRPSFCLPHLYLTFFTFKSYTMKGTLVNLRYNNKFSSHINPIMLQGNLLQCTVLLATLWSQNFLFCDINVISNVIRSSFKSWKYRKKMLKKNLTKHTFLIIIEQNYPTLLISVDKKYVNLFFQKSNNNFSNQTYSLTALAPHISLEEFWPTPPHETAWNHWSHWASLFEILSSGLSTTFLLD